ncbi:hypothetical protein KY358_03620 [Candidatus Woesearchaeota archaeon]|nr:hypothetical protein [Candidatus Woesearchaeota archaeon]
MAEEKKYPEGHFLRMWMAIGMILGIPFAFALGGPQFIGLGFGMGICIGLAIGYGIESKYKREGKIRPLTEKEKKRKKLAVLASVTMLLLGVVAFLFMYLR